MITGLAPVATSGRYEDLERRRTQWDPRWANIDLDAGYTEFTYTDDNDVAITPNPYLMPVACTGSRQNGAVYYFSDAVPYRLYKKTITNGVVGNAEVVRDFTLLGDSTPRHGYLSINEETGAAFYGTYQSWAGYLSPSIETPPTITTPNNLWSSNHHIHAPWINNKILIGNRLYDGNNLSYVTVPVLGMASAHTMTGDAQGGIFIQQGFIANPSTVYSYDMANNTLTSLFSIQAGDNASRRPLVRDTAADSFLTKISLAERTQIGRTTDGVTFSSPLSGGSQGVWNNRFFPHINTLWTMGRNSGAITYGMWWNGNTDTVGNAATADSLFPGYLPNYFYAGKQMLVNGNRLWDIVPNSYGLREAPNDGKLYGRKNRQWVEIVI
jgi:hypothetical protein